MTICELANKVKERLLTFIAYKELSVSAFEKACGLSNGYIRNFKGNLGGAKLEDILNAFPELSRDWLLFGKEEASENQPENRVEEKPEEKDSVERMLLLVESQSKVIESLTQLIKAKDEKIEELLEELDARKGGNATDVAPSSSASAI